MDNLKALQPWIPSYQGKNNHIYIFLTSLNLGGAEKIVSDQLWANHHQKNPNKVTLIVLYEKEKEHSIPPDVNVVRLYNNISNGDYLFKLIAYEKQPLVAHLINDKISNHLFSFGLKIHLVIHNDKRGWNNDTSLFSHDNIISLISVCDFVTKQLKEVTDKPIITLRHNINHYKYPFDETKRKTYRDKLNLKENDILIGMTGRIVLQKNYFLALDIIAQLSRKNKKYKLIILGGFIQPDTYLYFELLQRINDLNIKDQVFIVGFKDNAYDWINAFDLALNTSHFEGLSMATQEFMRNGLNVVLSNVSGQPEILNKLDQLHYFDLPTKLNTPETRKLYIDAKTNFLSLTEKQNLKQYKKLVTQVSNLILKQNCQRFVFDNDYYKYMDYAIYGSHNIWNTLNFIQEQPEITEEKAAFVTVNLNLGGAQRSLVNLACYLKENGHDIPVILTHQSNYLPFYQKLLESHVETYLCHKQNEIFTITNSLFQYVYENKITTLIFWNLDSKIKLLISKLLDKKIKIIDVSPGDYCLVEMDNNKEFQDAVYYNSQNYFSRLSKFVSKFDNSALKQDYKKHLTSDIAIIPNGVPIYPEYLKTEYLTSHIFKFLVVGRIAETKYIHTILESYEELIKTNPNISIDFYGNVEDYSYDYYQQLQERFSSLFNHPLISFKGSIDEPMSVMKNYDCIIVLGIHQGSPNTVLEAAACKLPIIANDSGGTKEVINKNTGILLPEKIDSVIVTQAMNDVIKDYNLAMNRSLYAFELIENTFSMKKMADSYLTLIKNIK